MHLRSIFATLICALYLVLGCAPAHAATLAPAPTAAVVKSKTMGSRTTVYAVPRPWARQVRANGGIWARRYGDRITDGAHLLGANERARLNKEILAIQERTQSEILLVTLPTLGGHDTKAFAKELFNTWGIGNGMKSGKGVLVVFVADGGARGKGRIQIEVAPSLNTAVSRSWTTGMLEASVLPKLRTRDYATGFTRAVERIEPRLLKTSGGEGSKMLDWIFGGGALSVGAYSSWEKDRRGRRCKACGTICARPGVGQWRVVDEATDSKAGRRERKVTCHKCGTTSLKAQAIPMYDGKRMRSDGTWHYYYDSGDSGGDGGGGDGGDGGGGGDC